MSVRFSRRTLKVLGISLFAAWLALTLYQIIRISDLTTQACGYSQSAANYVPWTPARGYPEMLFFCGPAR